MLHAMNTYRAAGVDIEAGNSLVRRIAPLAAATTRPEVMDSLGGFGALFDLKKSGYKDPVLVACTDGVGTKLKLAFTSGLHDSVGIDLVAMSVNDLIVQGAEPLFFLDYFATGQLDVEQAESVISGIAAGCKEAGCALIGGETAEMPGLYASGEYDLAGFAVGVVERDHRLPRQDAMGEGDIVLGLASSGVHSNGFSLVRHICATEDIALDEDAPFEPGKTLAEALLTPTRIYIKSILSTLKDDTAIKGLAHITGGGLTENLPRVLPDTLGAKLDPDAWEWLPVFTWLRDTGNIPAEEMLRTFNCGIGMAIIVSEQDVKSVRTKLEAAGETVYRIGELTSRQPDTEAVIYS